MRQTLIAVFSLLLAGCQSMPEKPVVEVGLMDFPASQMACGLSDGSDPIHREPLSTYDRATCFKPDAWAAWKTYVELLEQYAAQCQKAQKEAGK